MGIVINIVTHRVTAGYAMGADATSAPKADMLRGSAYAKLNRENSEFSINYSGAYSQMDGMHTAERTDYQMGDIGFKLTWSLTKGRQVKGIERDVEGLKDMETGVTRSGK
ncbi:MAG: hypothetical protein MR037_08470 [Bacteroidales bacterium]|nr:hypothetical protein [Bacteroidales bacterium]